MPYNGNSHKALDRVHVKYVLFKGANIQNHCYLCPKGGLNLAKLWLFTSVIMQDTNLIVSLKLLTTGTNVTTVLCAQGKKLNLVLS